MKIISTSLRRSHSKAELIASRKPLKYNERVRMAGYSETPLIKKLGIKAGFNIAFVNAPADFFEALTLPPDVKVNSRSKKSLDCVLLFVESEKDLLKTFGEYAEQLLPAGMIWVAWPKKSSGVTTDLSFNNVQTIGLAAGLVDVKICAISEVWSGLKFVFRLKDRARLKVSPLLL